MQNFCCPRTPFPIQISGPVGQLCYSQYDDFDDEESLPLCLSCLPPPFCLPRPTDRAQQWSLKTLLLAAQRWREWSGVEGGRGGDSGSALSL